MDEVRIVRQRTHIWPVVIALIILAVVIAYVFFADSGPANQVGSNDSLPLLVTSRAIDSVHR